LLSTMVTKTAEQPQPMNLDQPQDFKLDLLPDEEIRLIAEKMSDEDLAHWNTTSKRFLTLFAPILAKHGGLIKYWMQPNTSCKVLHGQGETVKSAAFSPDGKRLAFGSIDRAAIQLWDVETGNVVKRLKNCHKYTKSIQDFRKTLKDLI